MPDFMKRRALARMLNRAAERLVEVDRPERGWIWSMRHALGMSAEHVAARKGVSRNAVYQAERSELDGAVSLKQMENLAKAMGGRFVYAIVPGEQVEALLHKQAQKTAKALAKGEVEFNAMSRDDQLDWLDDKAAELLHDMPADFWDISEVKQ